MRPAMHTEGIVVFEPSSSLPSVGSCTSFVRTRLVAQIVCRSLLQMIRVSSVRLFPVYQPARLLAEAFVPAAANFPSSRSDRGRMDPLRTACCRYASREKPSSRQGDPPGNSGLRRSPQRGRMRTGRIQFNSRQRHLLLPAKVFPTRFLPCAPA